MIILECKSKEPAQEQSEAADMNWNEKILQNLQDAGCGQELITRYEKLAEQKICERAIRGQQTQLLREYRKNLLAQLHEDQRRIDCLDHLLYQLRS
jgi:hypothetical protein